MRPAHIKSQRQKEIRRIRKRQRQIWEEEKRLGYIELEQRIRHGWYKELIITENVERYKNQKYILELYDCVEKCFWGKNKEEATKKWLHQTSKYLIDKEIPTISKRQFNKLSEGAKRLCTPFQYYTERKKLRTRFYINIPKNAYRIKFTRAYITHRKRIDPELISEDALLEQQLLKNGYYELAQTASSWRNRWATPERRKEKLETASKLRELTKYAIQEIINEELSWERN